MWMGLTWISGFPIFPGPLNKGKGTRLRIPADRVPVKGMRAGLSPSLLLRD